MPKPTSPDSLKLVRTKEKKDATLSRDSYALRSFSSVQFSSIAQLCLTLCDPMNSSMPGFPVHCQLLEHTPTHAS